MIKKSVSNKRKFVKAPGRPISDDDAVVIGDSLVKIAESCKIGDIRCLNPKTVFEAVYSDKKHPMRYLYGDFKDVSGAARKHWIEHSRMLINSVRVVVVGRGVDMPEVRDPLFVSADVQIRTPHGQRMRRSHVLREDTIAHDAQFMSAIRIQITTIEHALASLEKLTSVRATPTRIVELRDSCREAFGRYYSAMDAAAE